MTGSRQGSIILRTRASRRTSSKALSLRTVLLILAFVPGIALTALWAVTSGQTFFDFQRMAAQGQLAQKAGQPSNVVYYNLQQERRLSADVLDGQDGAAASLTRQRELTDRAVRTFLSLSDDSAVDNAPAEVRDAVAEAREAIGRLSVQRALVDSGDADQQETVYRYYTDLIAVDLKLFTALSHVDNGQVTTVAQPLVDLFWTKEMISRSDALLARGWGRDRLSPKDFQQVQREILNQSFQQDAKITPYLPDEELAMWREITSSQAWRNKNSVEQALLRPAEPDAKGEIRLGDKRQTWRAAMDTITPAFEKLLEHRTERVVQQGLDGVLSLLSRMVLTTVIGLAAVVAVIWTTWRLTRSLRLRIGRLQEQAEALEKALPEVVERLGRGEQIDVQAEARAVEEDTHDGASDELAKLGHALNLARTSALQAAVGQADQHRGFERLLQRIARRTQQLIGQQLKKLDEMEHRHEDPEVLDGLFDLDHLTARLRRYEENLVILSGGTPHRRWRKPVALLDVMRSAQGEVQDYRRVVLDLDGSPWLAARAVGPVTHVLAELIENALSFSRPPSPVEVRAAAVSRGLVIEVEDRGLGMEEEQLAEANALMLQPSRLDILAHAEDIRLGLHVIARLTHQYGLSVEFRPSAYGGTRVVVLVPGELVVAGPRPAGPVAVPPGPVPVAAPTGAQDPLPSRRQGEALAAVTRLGPLTPAAPDHAEHGYPGHHPYAMPEMPEDPLGRPHDEQAPGPAGTPYEEAPAAPYGTPPTAYGTPQETPAPYGTRHEPPAPAPYGETHPVPDTFAPAAPPYGSAQPYGATDAYPAPGQPADGGFGGHGGPEQDRPPSRPAEHPGFPTRYVSPLPAHQEQAVPSMPAPSAPSAPSAPDAPSDAEVPLPRRVRQASLVDGLRLDPAAQSGTPQPPRWQDDPLLRPAPRRAGATIGAFQRRSRAARSAEPPSPDEPGTSRQPTREEDGS